jgi:hypothetical protein
MTREKLSAAKIHYGHPEGFLLSQQLFRRSGGHNGVQFTASIVLSLLTFLLLANVTMMLMACSFNAHVCRDAVRAGARAAAEGEAEEIVTKVVEYSVETAIRPGFFVARPEVHFVKFASLNGAKCLVVSTITKAKLPAPMLLLNAEAAQNGFVVFSKTYIVSLANAAKEKV